MNGEERTPGVKRIVPLQGGSPDGLTFQLGPVCPVCRRVLEPNISLEYFGGMHPPCGNCGHPVDWWSVLVTMLRESQTMQEALALAGARWTYFRIELKPDENYQLNMAEHDIPQDARLLSVGYTPQGGGLFPIEWHGNFPARRPSMQTILIPIEIGPKNQVGLTQVAVVVAWLPSTGGQVPWRDFVRALEAHVAGDYEGAVIPASAAVESGLSRFLKKILLEHASKERVDTFLRDAATFGQQLNVLLPTIAALKGWPALPDEIRGQVNRLRELRNELAHDGRLSEPLTADDAGLFLAAALLAQRYVSLLSEKHTS